MTEEEWLKSADPQRMLKWVQRTTTDRKLRLFAVASCHLTVAWLRGFYPHEPSSVPDQNENVWKTIRVAEQFADGLLHTSKLDLEKAYILADNRFDDVGALSKAFHSTANPCAWDAAFEVASVLDESVWDQEVNNLGKVCLWDIFGNPFRPVTVNPTWLTPTVTNLAAAAYEELALPSGELDTARLAILADAVAEAGCDNQEILGHLRSSGPHVRGCLALDLLLGKE